MYILYTQQTRLFCARTFFVFYQSTSKCIHIDFVVGSSTFGRVGCDWNLPWRFPKLIQRHFVKNFNRGKNHPICSKLSGLRNLQDLQDPLKTHSLKMLYKFQPHTKTHGAFEGFPKCQRIHPPTRIRGTAAIKTSGQLGAKCKALAVAPWMASSQSCSNSGLMS